jgi:hypothetical protein
MSVVDFFMRRYSWRFYSIGKMECRDIIIDMILKHKDKPVPYLSKCIYYELVKALWKQDEERCAITGMKSKKATYHCNYLKEYYKKYPQKQRAYSKKYYWSNREKVLERLRLRRMLNPEKYRLQNAKSYANKKQRKSEEIR